MSLPIRIMRFRRRMFSIMGNVSTAGKITYLPIYMLMFVEKKKIKGELIYKLDLSALQGE